MRHQNMMLSQYMTTQNFYFFTHSTSYTQHIKLHGFTILYYLIYVINNVKSINV
jgi:hypothetical protein